MMIEIEREFLTELKEYVIESLNIELNRNSPNLGGALSISLGRTRGS